MKTLFLIPIIAVLVACKTTPPACEDSETKETVSTIFLQQAKVDPQQFDAKFDEVITQKETPEGQVCTAKITYTMSDNAKDTWHKASQKLEKSITLTPTGYPTSPYLPKRATTVMWFLTNNDLYNNSTLLHLAPTSYFTHMLNYMSPMGSEQHPEHMTLLAHNAAVQEVFADAKIAGESYDAFVNRKITIEIAYFTHTIKRNGKVEGQVRAIADPQYFEEFQLLSYHQKRAIQILEN